MPKMVKLRDKHTGAVIERTAATARELQAPEQDGRYEIVGDKTPLAEPRKMAGEFYRAAPEQPTRTRDDTPATADAQRTKDAETTAAETGQSKEAALKRQQEEAHTEEAAAAEASEPLTAKVHKGQGHKK